MSLLPQRDYDEAFVARVRELATIQLTPSMIADRLGLGIGERSQFLKDVANRLHPISAAYRTALGGGFNDVMDALHSTAVEGDTSGIELFLRTVKEREMDELKKELFDV